MTTSTPADRDTHEPSARGKAWKLCALLIFAALFWSGSNALVVGTPGFWVFGLEEARSANANPLAIEAVLHLAKPGSVRVVLVGNSVLEFNVSPLHLARRLGLDLSEILVLAVPAANTLELAMLTPAIQRLAPDLVVYFTAVGDLDPVVNLDAVRFYDPAFAIDMFTPAAILGERRFHAAGWLSASHVVYRHRDRLREAFLNWFGRDETLGGVVWDIDDPAVEEFLDSLDARNVERLGCDGIKRQALETMARRFVRDGIAFQVIATPVNSDWQQTEGIPELLDRCMSETASRSGFEYVGFDRTPKFRERDFFDPFHMDKSGRSRFSRHLVDQIARGLGLEAQRVAR